MDNVPTPRFTPTGSAFVTVVRFRERVADAIAAVCLLTGAGLFLFARQALRALANGTYLVPAGTTYVSRADLHSAQSKIGLWLLATGLAVAIAAAMSHSRARRIGAQRAWERASAR